MSHFSGKADPEYNTTNCTGILLTNLGTPDAASTQALRTYLAEFLSDPRIIEVPRPLWWFILHGFILRFRPKRSAAAYQKIWTDVGSPLLAISKKQAIKIQALLEKKFNGLIKVELAMRYGNPSIKASLERLRQAHASRILIFPLYPQYSASTTASTFDAVADVLKTWRCLPEIRMINHYYDHSGYINALSNRIRRHWNDYSKPEKLLFSFHGMPKHYVDAGDPYADECQKTAQRVASELGLNHSDWQITFQSRFGPQDWLQPYTDKTLIELAEKGIKHVQVVCPGFSADCLETLEEINIRNRAFFIDAGGENFSYIPALNDDDEHIAVLSKIILAHCQGWGSQQD